ncbi:MAG: superoxide dismutase [Bacteroidales bacterium]|nr:superoxide dismutase [Bacteroidales bacterium]
MLNKKLNELIFPQLNYEYSALEPYIDAQTMELHYSKHHQGYFTNLLNAVKDTELENKSLLEIFENISNLPVAIRNNGGGHFNHSLFWNIMSPDGKRAPSGELLKAIEKDFGSFDQFKSKFEDAAKTRFGSGWAWLSVKKDKSLCVCSSANQDNPLMDVSECKAMPILGLDVWEHAYYLKYQNRRPDYVNNFWNVADWDVIENNYKLALNSI